MYTITVWELAEASTIVALVAAMQLESYFALKCPLKVPSLDHTDTLLFALSTTYKRPSEPNAMS